MTPRYPRIFEQIVSKSQVRLYSAPVNGSVPTNKQKYVPTTGTYPVGFSVSGTHVGIKPSNTHFPDLALITSDRPCASAAVFTKNKFQAAPVIVSRETLEKCEGKGIRAIVVNSGCANAVTGRGGLQDAQAMASTVDRCLPSTTLTSRTALTYTNEFSSTLVMSTGVIGQRLPIQKILDALPSAKSALSTTHDSWLSAARAICTTDTFPKLLSRTFTLPGNPGIVYSIAGIAKGAGMIHPNMATLLGIICTDANIPANVLKPLLTHAVDRSFNCISVDGDTSTNDTVAMLANGALTKAPKIHDLNNPQGLALKKFLVSFLRELSQLVIRDGEGATKFVHVRVVHAPTQRDARAIASSIARSPLVKTALYGKDANWGRILCAVGYTQGISPDAIRPEQVSVSFTPLDGSPTLKLLVKGEPEAVDEQRAAKILECEDLEIRVDLRNGVEKSSYWFCDFSHEYASPPDPLHSGV
ncbi:hypothetical protein MMC14_008335 [Varicellaria rhodocarpa]|nr:hypothetical protein [Varicellaria rhodocarpa]